MLTNGFNAINVQLASRLVDLMISARDLSRRAVTDGLVSVSDDQNETNASSSVAAAFGAAFNNTLLEEAGQNPSSNTALRSAFVPMELAAENICSGKTDINEQDLLVPSFCFPLRLWQSQVLTEAAELTKSIEFTLDTSATMDDIKVLSSHGVDANAMELPMKTSIAINLMIQSVLLAEKKLKWWRPKIHDGDSYLGRLAARDFAAKKDLVIEENDNAELSVPDLYFNAAPSPSDKDVLKSALTLLRGFFGNMTNVSSSEVRVELSSRKLSSGFTFNAITFEIPLVPSFLSRHLDLDEIGNVNWTTKKKNTSGAWFYDIDWRNNCTGSACVVNEPEYDLGGNLIKIKAQVQAQAICWDNTLQEELPYQILGNENWQAAAFYSNCDVISNSSMRVMGMSKRIQGDAITIRDNGYIVQLKNARKVYSFTLGDLSWQEEDLAKVYGATCNSTDATLCHGLRYKLSPSQHLILGNQYLPLDQIPATTGEFMTMTTLPLVSFSNGEL